MPCPCWAQARNCRTRAQARNCSLFRAWQQTAARHSQGWPQDRSGRQISEAGLRVKKHLSSKLYNAGVGGSSQGPLGRGNWENRQPWQPQAPACPTFPALPGGTFFFSQFSCPDCHRERVEPTGGIPLRWSTTRASSTGSVPRVQSLQVFRLRLQQWVSLHPSPSRSILPL